MDQDQLRTRSHYLMRLVSLLIIVSAAWPASLVFGQESAKAQPAQLRQTQKATSYAFVSPNTRENLTLQEAIAGLSSPDEKKLIEETRLVACRLHLGPRVEGAVGSWTDGAENSTVLRIKSDEATVRYTASWLGKFARQKTVLYFRRSLFGRARMYVLFLSGGNRDLAAVAAELDSDGVANRTLVPRRKRLLIYVVDLRNELQARVQTAARRLRARLALTRGDGAFIGDENDRDKARAIFEQETRKYEVVHSSVRRPCRKKTRRARVEAVFRQDLSAC